MKTKLVLLAVLLLSVLLVGAVTAQGGYEPVFEETDCLFDVPGITCGVLIVPEDRTDPAGQSGRVGRGDHPIARGQSCRRTGYLPRRRAGRRSDSSASKTYSATRLWTPTI